MCTKQVTICENLVNSSSSSADTSEKVKKGIACVYLSSCRIFGKDVKRITTIFCSSNLKPRICLGIPLNEVKNTAYYFRCVNISGKLILDVARSSSIENRREV